MKLDCYLEAYFEGLLKHEDYQDPVCVNSRTGYVMTLVRCTLYWLSKLQNYIALSTLESEYISLSQAMRDLLSLRQFLQKVGTQLKMDLASPAIMHSTVF